MLTLRLIKKGIPQSPPAAATAPFNKGASGARQGPSSAQKPPLSKGGATKWRGDSICRKSVGRGDPGAPFSGGEGFRTPEPLKEKESPSHRLRRRQPPLARGPLEQDRDLQASKSPPCQRGCPEGAGGFRLQEICRARRPRRAVLRNTQTPNPPKTDRPPRWGRSVSFTSTSRTFSGR